MKAIVLESSGDLAALYLQEIAKRFDRDRYPPRSRSKRLVSIGLRCLHVRDTLPMCNCPACWALSAWVWLKLRLKRRFNRVKRWAAIMGGMGRAFDGSYAEYVCVPQACVFLIESDLDWAVLGAIPEMFQTAYDSLISGLGVQAGQTLLIRGGTSSVGMTAAHLAKALSSVQSG